MASINKEEEAAVKEKKLEIDDLEMMRSYVTELKNVLSSTSIMEQKAFLK